MKITIEFDLDGENGKPDKYAFHEELTRWFDDAPSDSQSFKVTSSKIVKVKR